MNRIALGIASCLIAATAMDAADATSLIGSTVTLTPVFANGDVQPSQTAVVDNGAEFQNIPFFQNQSIDISADYIDFTELQGSTFSGSPPQFNGFFFSFAGFDLSSPVLLAGPSSVSYEVNSYNQLAVGFAGQYFPQGTDTRIGITASPSSSAVPEPSTWLMLVIGASLGGALMRRRRITQARLV